MAAKQINLDGTDWKILETLQQNCRATFTDIGQAAGLTAPAVRERIRRMEEADLITGYKPVIDYTAIGRPIHAMIELKFKSGSRAEQYPENSLISKLKDIPGVVRIWLVTGDSEWILEVSVMTMKHLDDILAQMNEIGFLTTTSMVLKDSGAFDCTEMKN